MKTTIENSLKLVAVVLALSPLAVQAENIGSGKPPGQNATTTTTTTTASENSSVDCNAENLSWLDTMVCAVTADPQE